MSTNKQKFHVNGFKFFRAHKEQLLQLHKEQNLSAAAIGTFMIVLNEVNSEGELYSDYKHTKLSKIYNVKYTTYTTGLYECMKHGLILTKEVNGKKIYFVNGYANENRSTLERPDRQGNLTYFKIPGAILRNEDVIQTLIRKKDATGLLTFIKMYDRCVTSLKDSKQSLTAHAQPYNFQNFKNTLNRSAKKVREYLSILSPVLNIEAPVKEIRKPREEKTNRVRKAVEQVWMDKTFYVHVSESIVIDEAVKSTVPALFSEAQSRLSAIQLPLRKQDLKGLRKAISDTLVSWKRYMNSFTFKHFSRSALQDALDQLETYIQIPGKTVDSVVAFLRTKLVDAADYYMITQLSEGERIDVASGYVQEKGKTPSFYKKWEQLKQA
ncbi:hypothetical protein [Priestia aryabhattai]|uniref:hypothetical protein n=1 Tax=Priestia aryabhattai TaxID=412384 RepID=UPI003CB24BC6